LKRADSGFVREDFEKVVDCLLAHDLFSSWINLCRLSDMGRI
jgi:hypothetical protein